MTGVVLRPDLVDVLDHAVAQRTAEAERDGELVVPAIGVWAKHDAAVLEIGAVIDEAHRDLVRKRDIGLLAGRQRSFELVAHTLLVGEHPGEAERVLDARATVALMTVLVREHRL